MAFVFREERKLNESPHNNHLGPGTYPYVELSKPEHKLVPFNSSTERDSIIRKQKIILPGPGEYDFYPFTDGQKVVLESAGSDVKVLEVPKPSSIFKSSTTRFDSRLPEPVPGPGAYFNDEHMQPTSKENKSKKNIVSEIMKLNRYQSIPSIPTAGQVYGYSETENQGLELNKPQLTITSGMPGDSVGPGHYTIKIPSKPKGAPWEKSKVTRLVSTVPVDNVPEVGPGTYETTLHPTPSYQQRPAFGFQSRSKRIFDQQKGVYSQEFLYNRLKSKQEDYLGQGVNESDSFEMEYMDDTTPGPGHYFPVSSTQSSTTASSRISHQRSEFSVGFGTKLKRFKKEEKIVDVGPGKYEVALPIVRRNRHDQRPPFESSDSRFPVKSQEARPGPQTYNNLKDTLQDQLTTKIQRGALGNFGTNVKRFQISEFSDQIPGPGHYQIPGIIAPPIQIQGSFKSRTRRDPFPPKYDNNPNLGPSDVKNFTIATATKMDIEEDPDLAVKKPPFGTGLPRFQQESKKILEVDEDDDDRLPIGRDINDLFMKEPKPRVPFLSSDKRFKYEIKNKTPAPGEHQDPIGNNQWSKRTFNILYAEI